MIVHIAEVWFALFVAFVVGCLAGTFLHRWIGSARSPARSMVAVAAAGVGDRTHAPSRATRATQRLDAGRRSQPASLEAEADPPWNDLEDLAVPAAVPPPEIEDDPRWVSEPELDEPQPAAVEER